MSDVPKTLGERGRLSNPGEQGEFPLRRLCDIARTRHAPNLPQTGYDALRPWTTFCCAAPWAWHCGSRDASSDPKTGDVWSNGSTWWFVQKIEVDDLVWLTAENGGYIQLQSSEFRRWSRLLTLTGGAFLGNPDARD